MQECHRKYAGDDPRFRALLDTTLEIVEEEVGTLRRLVGDFSNFARLPHAELLQADLRDFLRECSEQLGAPRRGLGRGPKGTLGPDFEARRGGAWAVPIPSAIDRQMLRRVLVNLVRNAVEAVRDGRAERREGGPRGHVRVSAERRARRDDASSSRTTDRASRADKRDLASSTRTSRRRRTERGSGSRS